MAEELPEARPAGVAAGLHLTADPPEGCDEAAICARAAQRSILLEHIGEHRLRPGPPALLLGYACLPEPAIRRGVREVAETVRGGGGVSRRSSPGSP